MLSNMRAAIDRVKSEDRDDEDRTRERWMNILLMIADKKILAANAKDIPTWAGWDADMLKNDFLEQLISKWTRLQVPTRPRSNDDVLKIYEICGRSH
jgi:hypothetical protein